MTNSLIEMDKEIEELASGRKALSSIKKQVLEEYILLTKEGSTQIAVVLNSLDDNNKKLLTKKIQDYKSDTNPVSIISLYKDVLNKLNRQAQKMEKDLIFSSIIQANTLAASLLDNIYKNIDNLFSNNVINIYNTKVSHTVILGLIHQSKILSTWSTYLYTGISSELAKIDNPKYRWFFISNNTDSITKYINDLCNKTGAYHAMLSINQIKKANQDIQLLTESTNKSNTGMILSNKLSSDNLALVKRGIHSYNPFRLIGEGWNLFKNWQVKNNIQHKQWLEAHTAMLKLELENKDKDSPEYIKLQNIIAAYEINIVKTDKVINEYYTADED
jgi:hypothetical protein